jgi:hypothetical protein
MPKPLKQMVSGWQATIMIQYVFQCLTLMLIELVRRRRAQPAPVEAANSWAPTMPPGAHSLDRAATAGRVPELARKTAAGECPHSRALPPNAGRWAIFERASCQRA